MQQLAAESPKTTGPGKHAVSTLTADSATRLQNELTTLAMINCPKLFPNEIPKDLKKREKFLDRRRRKLKDFFKFTDEEVKSLLTIHRSPKNGPMQAKAMMKDRMLKLNKGKVETTYLDKAPQHPLS